MAVKITYSRVLKFLNRLKDKNPSLLNEGEEILIDRINNPINDCFSRFGKLSHPEKKSLYLCILIGQSWKMKQRIHIGKNKKEKIPWREKFIEMKANQRDSWERHLLSGKESDKPDKPWVE
jgi:hypothetical protein